MLQRDLALNIAFCLRAGQRSVCTLKRVVGLWLRHNILKVYGMTRQWYYCWSKCQSGTINNLVVGSVHVRVSSTLDFLVKYDRVMYL